MDAGLTCGRATPEGTRRFAARFPDRPGHFRCPDRLEVASLGLGMRSGEAFGADDLLYRSAVPQVLQGGVNLFDTALSERMQMSERNLGTALERAFREGDARRDEVVVVTKGGFLTVDPDLVERRADVRRYLVETYIETGLVAPARIAGGVHSLDPDFLLDQIDRSRRNLGLATIDVWCIEEPELHLPAGADVFCRRLCTAFEALEGAVADGRIGAYGLATWDGLLRPHTDRHHLSILDVFTWALDVGGADHHLRAVQLPYGVAAAEALRLPSQIGPSGVPSALLDALRGTGTLVLASAPMMQGRALGALPESVRAAFPGLHSDAQRCLQFARSAPGITAAIVGMRDPDHIDENLAVSKVPPLAREAVEALFKRGADAAE
jgi:aryl-alcohol dehydrogenase-like predicted oxidoreductase